MSHFSFPPGDVTGTAEGEYQHTPHRLEAAVPALSDKSRAPIEATLPAVAEVLETVCPDETTLPSAISVRPLRSGARTRESQCAHVPFGREPQLACG